MQDTSSTTVDNKDMATKPHSRVAPVSCLHVVCSASHIAFNEYLVDVLGYYTHQRLKDVMRNFTIFNDRLILCNILSPESIQEFAMASYHSNFSPFRAYLSLFLKSKSVYLTRLIHNAIFPIDSAPSAGLARMPGAKYTPVALIHHFSVLIGTVYREFFMPSVRFGWIY